MDFDLLAELERTFQKCSDCGLHPEYVTYLNQLDHVVPTQELVDYLCSKSTSKKHIWEIRFDHLRVLLRNPSSQAFDLKSFYLENLKKSRRLAVKIFYIRGYAFYASEKELIPIMERFCRNLEGSHDYTDFSYILSVAGLPYLVETYGYPCFIETLEKAKQEYQKVSPLLQGYFTLNENLEQVNLLPPKEISNRMNAFINQLRSNR